MVEISNREKKIAKNTLALYTQTVLAMIVALYTSRVLLKELGVDDFGLYNVVGGLVVLFGIVSSSMSSATNRFLNIELGKKNEIGLISVFNTSLAIYFLAGILIVILLETVGLWFLLNKMNFENNREGAAIYVFHASVLTLFIGMMNGPYIAVTTSYERMYVFAFLSILDYLLKLLAVIAIPFFMGDKLIIYAVLLVVIQLVIQFISWSYCRKSFPIVRAKFVFDKPLFKSMMSFAGWATLDKAAFMAYTQGVNIMLNIFFGTAVNASRSIAVQVQGLIARLVGNIQYAVTPQIIQAYGSNELRYMHQLIISVSKISFCFVLLIGCPILFETENILKLWLDTVNDQIILFIRIMILITFVECLGSPLSTAVVATGKIKKFNVVISVLMVLILPISYFFLSQGGRPETVFYVNLILIVIVQVFKVFYVSKVARLSIGSYLNEIFFKCFAAFTLICSACYLIHIYMQPSFLRIFTTSIVTSVLLMLIGVAFILSKSERRHIKEIIIKKKNNQS